MLCVTAFTRAARFQSEALALDPDTARALGDALVLLMRNPAAKSLRLHPLGGYGKPTIWKIDIYSNRSWQVTFEMNGTTAHLKRVASHKNIDRDPRG